MPSWTLTHDSGAPPVDSPTSSPGDATTGPRVPPGVTARKKRRRPQRSSTQSTATRHLVTDKHPPASALRYSKEREWTTNKEGWRDKGDGGR